MEKEVSSQLSIFMTTPESIKMSFCKESNNLVRSTNFLALKKRIDLILIENEVDHVKGSIIKSPKEDAQAHARYMKGKVRAQRILIDPLIPYVSK